MSGAASPCVFFHPERNITVVVHGDDFNALGVSDDLSLYEDPLKHSFEIKIRGRMGPDGNCDEIKILNRILRLTTKGLTYESDPRHVDLLTSSMGLTIGNAVSTPGTKEPNAGYTNNETEFQNGFDGDDGSGRQQRTIDADAVQCSRVNMVKSGALTNKHGPRTSTRHVTFKEETEQRGVQGYATIYGIHPSLIKSARTGMVQM